MTVGAASERAPSRAVVGYTIESSFEPETTRAALERIWAYHTASGVPATLFLLGRSIETNHRDLHRFAETPLFDLAQHTYSHIGFKSIVEDRGDGRIRYLPGATQACIGKEVEQTNKLIARHFGRECVGVQGARGYHLGLLDRPDLVALLNGLGARYCVTYCRNRAGWNPVELDVQPYWYFTGSGERLLEIPNQGWQDAAYIKVYGAGAVTRYFEFCRGCLDVMGDGGLTVAFIMHDWVVHAWDPDFVHMGCFLDSVVQRGTRICSCRGLLAQLTARPQDKAWQQASLGRTQGLGVVEL